MKNPLLQLRFPCPPRLSSLALSIHKPPDLALSNFLPLPHSASSTNHPLPPDPPPVHPSATVLPLCSFSPDQIGEILKALNLNPNEIPKPHTPHLGRTWLDLFPTSQPIRPSAYPSSTLKEGKLAMKIPSNMVEPSRNSFSNSAIGLFIGKRPSVEWLSQSSSTYWNLSEPSLISLTGLFFSSSDLDLEKTGISYFLNPQFQWQTRSYIFYRGLLAKTLLNGHPSPQSRLDSKESPTIAGVVVSSSL